MNIQTDVPELGRAEVKTLFLLDIEGKGIVHWEHETITVEQIIGLGGWEMTAVVIEVDHENNERTLAALEVVRLHEKHNFGKKHRWKRG